jgi:hypothetical protein
MKEEFNKDMESLRKNIQTEILEIKRSLSQIKKTEIHCRGTEQVEDRNSGHKDKIHIKEKTEEFLDKRLKSCERNMQEFCNSIRKPILRHMGIKGEEVQAKG